MIRPFLIKTVLLILISFIFLLNTFFALAKDADLEEFNNSQPILLDKYEYILNKYVSNNGLVNYYGMKKDLQYLDLYLFSLKNIPESTYNSWNEDKKISFWVNAYNAITLRIVSKHYPINTLRSKKYPKNSIKQIPGVWKRYKYSIINKKLSLDEIENNILKKEFSTIKILFTINNASKGSVPLRNEPFYGDRLNSQIADQVRKFVNSPENFQIDLINSTVTISPLFKWYAKDFLKDYENENKFNTLKPENRAAITFIEKYINKKAKTYLYSKKFSVEYLNYDWSLNETGY